jgi:hypothetical protein
MGTMFAMMVFYRRFPKDLGVWRQLAVLLEVVRVVLDVAVVVDQAGRENVPDEIKVSFHTQTKKKKNLSFRQHFCRATQ